nr:MAG TPA: Portal protein, Proximal tail tube, phi29, mature virion, VIRUS.3A [Caudoviricetes sp.]
MSATVSLLGLKRLNEGILGELVVPEGVDIELVKDNLLAETAELEVIYPDAYFMQAMIGRWSAKELPVWDRLYKTTLLEYNPIENYDRKEKWTEDENTTRNTDSEATGTSKTETEGTSKQHRENEIEHGQNKYVSAYNETDFTPTERTQDSQQEIGDTTQEDNGNVNVTAKSGNITDETGKRLLDREGKISGNTGFYTKQKMIEQERDIAMYNIIDVIINSFKNRFCLLVY